MWYGTPGPEHRTWLVEQHQESRCWETTETNMSLGAIEALLLARLAHGFGLLVQCSHHHLKLCGAGIYLVLGRLAAFGRPQRPEGTWYGACAKPLQHLSTPSLPHLNFFF